eukprot:bmy_18703T0
MFYLWTHTLGNHHKTNLFLKRAGPYVKPVHKPKSHSLEVITLSYDCHYVSDERTYSLTLKSTYMPQTNWMVGLTSSVNITLPSSENRHQLRPNYTKIQSEVEVREQKSAIHNSIGISI